MHRSRLKRAVITGMLAVGFAASIGCAHQTPECMCNGATPATTAALCNGGPVTGFTTSPSPAAGQITPEAALDQFLKTESRLPNRELGRYVIDSSATSTESTLVPMTIFVHQAGSTIDGRVRVVRLDGSTWSVDSASYCP